jgi:hypothetical protein
VRTRWPDTDFEKIERTDSQDIPSLPDGGELPESRLHEHAVQLNPSRIGYLACL